MSIVDRSHALTRLKIRVVVINGNVEAIVEVCQIADRLKLQIIIKQNNSQFFSSGITLIDVTLFISLERFHISYHPVGDLKRIADFFRYCHCSVSALMIYYNSAR